VYWFNPIKRLVLPPKEGRWRERNYSDKNDCWTSDGQRVLPSVKPLYFNLDSKADLQAIGIEGPNKKTGEYKNRVYYKYSKVHVAGGADTKFSRVRKFEKDLPYIVKAIKRDASKRDEALVLSLIHDTAIRVGTEKDTKATVKAYGAATLKCGNVKELDEKTVLDFIGKEGIHLVIPVEDSNVAKALHDRCRKVPQNRRMFNTNDDRIRDYLHSLPHGDGYKVSDWRPYHATRIARELVATTEAPKSTAEYKRKRKQIGVVVGLKLGNTPGMALGSYIDPKVFDPWKEFKPKPKVKK